MTIIQSGQSIPLSLSAGQSLVVKDMSGTSSVAGSVTREDAQSRIGQGFFVYGPVASAASVTLTTTGVTDYQIVNGDPTPANQQMLFDPGNPPTSGPTLSGASAGAVLTAVPRPVSRILCVLEGDSHAAENGPIVSGTTISYPEVGWFNWLSLTGAFENVGNYGVGGQTTAQILQRTQASIAAAKITGAKDVFICCGANDVNDAGYVESATKLNMAAIYAAWSAAGFVVHVMTTFPQYAQSAARGANIARLRNWQLQQASCKGYQAHDSWLALIDPSSITGAAKQYYLRSDNLHPSVKGARAISSTVQANTAARIAAATQYHAGAVIESVAYDAATSNIVQYPLITGAVSSGVAAGMQAQAGSGTATLTPSVAARADGFGNNQILAMTGMSANAEPTFRTNDNTASRISAGTSYAVEAHIAASNMAGIKRITMRAIANVGGTNYLWEFLSPSNLPSTEYDQTDWSGWVRIPVISLPGVPTSFNLVLLPTAADAGASATLAMGRISVVPASTI